MLHLYVHGRGRGHATRSIAIAKKLRERGHQLRVFAGPDAVSLLESDFPTTAIESLPPTPSLSAAALLRQRLDAARNALRQDGAAAVIADGDLPGLLAARMARKPGIAVGHGLVFSRCHRPRFLQHGPWYREAIKAGLSAPWASHYVPVNFVPLKVRGDNTTLARPTIDPTVVRALSGERVLCYFRDGAPKVLRMLVSLGARPLVFGPKDPRVDGIEYHRTNRAAFVSELNRARAVVASSGSQLLSECISLQVPILALYHRDDDEQRLNASMIQAFGLGDGCAFEALSQARLERFLASQPTPAPLDFDAADVATTVADLTANV